MKKLLLAAFMVCFASQAYAEDYTLNITADSTADTTSCFIPILSSSPDWVASVKVEGSVSDFGGGTVTFKWADDKNGTNAVAIDDLTGVDSTFTAEGTRNYKFGAFYKSGMTVPYICAVMSGSTTPDVDIIALVSENVR